MISEKLQYDAKLGGTVQLENHVQTFRYVADNVTEIRELLQEIRNPKSTKLVFQTLPKHMRRRAMSHHPNRLPRKYRSIHKSQMAKAGKPQSSKRPSRKFRRKPSNLLQEYLRRQRKSVWLETHIWHAKRFHMINKWGYRLPYASCDKTYRACYRATSRHCLVQDISYYACIEISGPLNTIAEAFQTLTSQRCGLSIKARTYLTGRREGCIDLFRAGQYPEGSLGKVQFIWKPQIGDERVVWIFVHPAAYREVLQEIIKAFQLKSMRTVKVPIQEMEEAETESVHSKKRELQLKFMTKTFLCERAPQYKNETTGIVLRELRDTMNRFRLTGPLSQSVLGHALKVKPFRESEPDNWFKAAMISDETRLFHEAQLKFWNNCRGLNSPAEVLSNMVLALNVEDPRINRPKKRSKALPENHFVNYDILLDTNETLCNGAIWDFELRSKICESMMTTQQFCSERAKNAVVPGERCVFEDRMQPVPLLLIQRPGSQDPKYKRLGYGCGWDVLVPSGYGMSVWLSLIMCGAKPGGLREFESIHRELGVDQFLLDSVPGIAESIERHNDLREKYFRLPPNKRCNFRKLSIVCPFKAPMRELVRDWTDGGLNNFFVLRDIELLQKLYLSVAQGKQILTTDFPPNGLIQVNLKMKSRGNPGDFALICLPTRGDLKRNFKNFKRANHDPVHMEPLKSDPHETERKKLKLEHKKLLKRLRRRRVREKRKLQETSEFRVKIRPAATGSIIAEQFKKMSTLWLPEDLSQSIRHQCSRQVFGYITRCEFSYTEAIVTGVGYVTVAGLNELISICTNTSKMCLVRATNSRNYRFASFKINLNV